MMKLQQWTCIQSATWWTYGDQRAMDYNAVASAECRDKYALAQPSTIDRGNIHFVEHWFVFVDHTAALPYRDILVLLLARDHHLMLL